MEPGPAPLFSVKLTSQNAFLAKPYQQVNVAAPARVVSLGEV